MCTLHRYFANREANCDVNSLSVQSTSVTVWWFPHSTSSSSMEENPAPYTFVMAGGEWSIGMALLLVRFLGYLHGQKTSFDSGCRIISYEK